MLFILVNKSDYPVVMSKLNFKNVLGRNYYNNYMDGFSHTVGKYDNGYFCDAKGYVVCVIKNYSQREYAELSRDPTIINSSTCRSCSTCGLR